MRWTCRSILHGGACALHFSSFCVKVDKFSSALVKSCQSNRERDRDYKVQQHTAKKQSLNAVQN